MTFGGANGETEDSGISLEDFFNYAHGGGDSSGSSLFGKTINELTGLTDDEWKTAQGRVYGAGKSPYTHPWFSRWYQKEALDQFRKEIPAADALYQGIRSGEDSAAVAKQRADMGQVVGAMNTAGASDNPIAARGAMYGGGNAAGGLIGDASMARDREVGAAQKAALESHLRQMGYQAALKKWMNDLATAQWRARRGADVAALGYAQQANAQQQALTAAGINAAAGLAMAGANAGMGASGGASTTGAGAGGSTGASDIIRNSPY